MALDRGTLAKIDRRVFAELDHADGVQMVKVPVSSAVWSTWRRYCEVIWISMGEGVAGLIVRELQTVARVAKTGSMAFADREERLANRHVVQPDAPEEQLETQERLQASEDHLTSSERRALARQVTGRVQLTPSRVGRNERCPCGSGLKYKRCHGR